MVADASPLSPTLEQASIPLTDRVAIARVTKAERMETRDSLTSGFVTGIKAGISVAVISDILGRGL